MAEQDRPFDIELAQGCVEEAGLLDGAPCLPARPFAVAIARLSKRMCAVAAGRALHQALISRSAIIAPLPWNITTACPGLPCQCSGASRRPLP